MSYRLLTVKVKTTVSKPYIRKCKGCNTELTKQMKVTTH